MCAILENAYLQLWSLTLVGSEKGTSFHPLPIIPFGYSKSTSSLLNSILRSPPFSNRISLSMSWKKKVSVFTLQWYFSPFFNKKPYFVKLKWIKLLTVGGNDYKFIFARSHHMIIGGKGWQCLLMNPLIWITNYIAADHASSLTMNYSYVLSVCLFACLFNRSTK